MTAIQLVVFDMAGTTVQDNNEVLRCFLAAATATGLAAEAAAVTPMMGWSKKRVFETLWRQQLGPDHAAYAAQVEASYRQFKAILEEHYQSQPVLPTDGCLAVFAALRSRAIAIGLNTGFYRQVTDIILQRLDWHQGLNSEHVGSQDTLIQVSVTPSEIYQNEGRPAPYMIQKAMYQLGVTDPQAVITLGDTPSDLAAGINAHCRWSLGVTSGTHTAAELAQHPNHGLLNHLSELIDKIDRLEAAASLK